MEIMNFLMGSQSRVDFMKHKGGQGSKADQARPGAGGRIAMGAPSHIAAPAVVSQATFQMNINSNIELASLENSIRRIIRTEFA